MLGLRVKRLNGPTGLGLSTAPRDFFAFDLASGETYLVADRVLKAAPRDLRWMPAIVAAPNGSVGGLDGGVEACEKRAIELGLPFQLPPSSPCGVPRAMRAADFAAAHGFGGAFMQLCSRLRFAGGFDIDGEVLATLNISGAPSSFAKGLLAAADDIKRDVLLAASTSWLEKEDIRRLPALRLDEKLVCGQAGIIQLLER